MRRHEEVSAERPFAQVAVTDVFNKNNSRFVVQVRGKRNQDVCLFVSLVSFREHERESFVRQEQSSERRDRKRLNRDNNKSAIERKEEGMLNLAGKEIGCQRKGEKEEKTVKR